MRPLVEFPDAALVATLWLRPLLVASSRPYAAGVTVTGKIAPGVTPTKAVEIRRSGGVAGLVDDSPRLDFRVWHTTDRDRYALANLVRSLVWQAPGTVVTSDVLPAPTTIGAVSEFIGPGPFPDPTDSTKEIVLFTFEIRLRGTAA